MSFRMRVPLLRRGAESTELSAESRGKERNEVRGEQEAMATRDHTRDGSYVTQRSEVDRRNECDALRSCETTDRRPLRSAVPVHGCNSRSYERKPFHLHTKTGRFSPSCFGCIKFPDSRYVILSRQAKDLKPLLDRPKL